MVPRILTAFEHESIPVGGGDGLSPAEADELAAVGELRPGFCERGYRSVRLAQYCGVVRLGERVLEVLPKVEDGARPETSRGVLLRLLGLSRFTPVFERDEAGQAVREAPLIEVFIAAYFDRVFDIARGGLLRRYQVEEDDVQHVRGRIVTTRQFCTLANRPDRIACRYDDLTADNVWNQVLKQALVAVRPWIASDTLVRRWVELTAVLSEVTHKQRPLAAIERLQYDRQATRYRPAITWAAWILGTLSPALRAGERQAPALLFDMNRLFESAVASVFRAWLRGCATLAVHEQEREHYLARLESPNRQVFGLRPDIVVRQRGDVLAICDAKWKRLAVGRPGGYLLPPADDVAQMHAYASSLGCSELALVYPWHSGLTGSPETRFVLPGDRAARIAVVCIDVGADRLGIVRGKPFLDAAANAECDRAVEG